MNTSARTSTLSNHQHQHPHPNTEHVHDHEHENDHDNDHRFACNICLENVSSPVVTRCGHLYCWPCLYEWLEPGMDLTERQFLNIHSNSNVNQWSPPVDITRRVCPVCKSGCSVKEVVPIYVREERSQERRVRQPPQQQQEQQQQQQQCVNVNVSEEEHSITIIDDELVDDDYRGTDGSLSSFDATIDANVDGTSTSHTDMHVDRDVDRDVDANVSAGTGLRRRRMTSPQETSEIHTSSAHINANANANTTPSRPLPPPSSIPQHVPSQSQHTAPLHPNLPLVTSIHNPQALHQSLFQALVGAQSHAHTHSHSHGNQGQGQSQGQSLSRSAIPSLHDRSRNSSLNMSVTSRSRNEHPHQQSFEEGTMRDAASEFLSRLLLMLGCFVILCLLLF